MQSETLQNGRQSWLQPGAAVIYAVLGRGWQTVAGLVTLLVISHFFSPLTQGYYYTFASLLALQVFVELGLGVVIINTASHEWARLNLDAAGSIKGDERSKARLVSLGRFMFRWYAAAAIVFVVVGGSIGYVFLSASSPESLEWQWPWIAAVIAVGAMLCVMPFVSLLEGCNQVRAVHQFRLWQAVATSLVLWAVIAAGGGLWASAATPFVGLICILYFLLVRYRNFFRAFWADSTPGRMHWRTEIWPMQWRLAAQGLVNYFQYSLFTPVILYYWGGEAAGRVGMTWQAVSALQMVALSWIQVGVPRFGALIAHGKYDELDREWRHAVVVSTAFALVASLALLFLVYVLNALGSGLSQRILDMPATSLFVAGLVFAHLCQCQAAYLRAHRREVLTGVAMVTALTMGIAVWWLGREFGGVGVAASYCGVMVLVAFPSMSFVWARARRKWRDEARVP